jgi:hypothetical protein
MALARMLSLGGFYAAEAYGIGKVASNIIGFRESYRQ